MKNRAFSLLGAFAIVLTLCGCGVTSTKDAVVALPTVTSFDFGQVVLEQNATSGIITLDNAGSQQGTVSVKLTGDPSLAIVNDLSCGSTLVAGGVCSVAVKFTPTAAGAVQGTLSLTLSTATDTSTQTVSITGTGVQISAGGSLVTPTINPVVARYTYQAETAGTVAVEFGRTTSYGTMTGSVATSADGSPVSILVAGMQQNMTYHMRAVLTASDGTVTDDQDHTFTTTSFSASKLPNFPTTVVPKITVTTGSGLTPQPGIELADASLSTSEPSDYLPAYATDLQGNIIWGYSFADRPTAQTIIQPIKMMPNGNFLVTLSFAQQYLLPDQGVTLTPADESVDLIREIDLAGDPVEQLTLATLNQKLAAAGYTFSVSDIHHDSALLPNGHIILITALLKSVTGVTGYPSPTTVLGDVLIDLDPNFNVDWVWNEFDHLDVNRHPMNFPDWTHTNAVLYSPADGNLLVSIRHQDWIVKVDYENGTGTGDVLWRLGNGGDFTLVGGTAPQDWFYAQHGPHFVTSATTGQFSLALMDNGDNRIGADGSVCGTSTPCYTTAPILAIDESAKTATVTSRSTPPASEYSEYGGNAEVLANGDLEYDLCSDPFGVGSIVQEVTTATNPQNVWTMTVTGANLYRAQRIPSLYPGVQW